MTSDDLVSGVDGIVSVGDVIVRIVWVREIMAAVVFKWLYLNDEHVRAFATASQMAQTKIITVSGLVFQSFSSFSLYCFSNTTSHPGL